ncbi:MAG TPA: bifunctional adenosylcobinamide kinase/adenosylcobinamide-phosphate guanylyltransferase [Ktedonobacteraceae bacterium]
MRKLVLILGGTRSGKSTFAERLARQSGKSVAFIATATPADEEMRLRIQRHRTMRPPEWLTIEEPLDIASATANAASQADVLLLDCMTLWLDNWLSQRGVTGQEEFFASTQYSDEVQLAVDALLRAFATLPENKSLIVVSNDVGSGIVPAYALGRLYRDLLGLVNQRLAQAATHVYLMIAGLGVDIKRLHEEVSL